MTARYAIYFVPPESHPLYGFGQHLLGRDTHLCRFLPQPALNGVAPARVAAITAAPRHYGFHATLKPPFRLAANASAEGLHAQVADFARTCEPFVLPQLEIAPLDRFIALQLTAPCPALDALAETCVRDFDAFRAPSDPAEHAKRRDAGLTARQEAMLERWGYPYVLDTYRFHLTLTARIGDDRERERVCCAIREICPPETLSGVPVDGLDIFGQPSAEMMFNRTKRFPFGG